MRGRSVVSKKLWESDQLPNEKTVTSFSRECVDVLGAAALAIPLSAFGLLDNTDKLSSLKIELIQVLRAEQLILEVTKSWKILT